MSQDQMNKIEIYYWTYDLPTDFRLCAKTVGKKEFERYYLKVCTMEIPGHIPEEGCLDMILETFSSKDENMLMKSPYHYQMIKDNHMHFTMGQSDIIRFNDNYHFITPTGFTRIFL
jgi:hypothetical protein